MRINIRIFIYISILLWLVACADPDVEPTKRAKKMHFVEVTQIQPSEIGIELQRLGSVKAKRTVNIVNQEEGIIKQMPFFEGDEVSKNQLLVRLDDDLINAQLQKAAVSRKKVALDLQRLKDLHAQQLSTEEQISHAETALAVAEADEKLQQTRLSYTKITAPFDAIISQRLLEPGNAAPRYTSLLTIYDPASLYIEVEVSELLLNQYTVDDELTVSIDAIGEQSYRGRISRIHPLVDSDTRTGTMEIELTPVPRGARPGQLVSVELRSVEKPRLLLPFKALRRDKQGEFVYLLKDNKAQVQRVKAGVYINERVEILEGLQNGDYVITKGFLDIKPGKSVVVVNESRE